ncbi:hypothetical protein ACQ86D_38660 [Streptomyces galilaeus]
MEPDHHRARPDVQKPYGFLGLRNHGRHPTHRRAEPCDPSLVNSPNGSAGEEH